MTNDSKDLQRLLRLARPHIKDVKPYIPGKALLENDLTILKLASNENTLGISSAVKERLIEELEFVHFYPDTAFTALRGKLAGIYDVPEEQIIMGNGSAELIYYIATVFLEQRDEMVMAFPSFPIFDIASSVQDCTRNYAPLRDFTIDLEAVYSLINERTKVVWLANPNNPTGTIFRRGEFQSFMEKIGNWRLIVVMDEAYYQYVDDPEYPDALTFLEDFPNIILLRTFSKIYGLAGLRIGLGISCAPIIDLLYKVKFPFNVNRLAQAALMTALDDDEYLETTLRLAEEGKLFLEDVFDRMGIFHIPTYGNFICFDSGVPADKLSVMMADDKVYVRPLTPFKMPTFFRLAIGTREENERFLEVFCRNREKLLAAIGKEAATEDGVKR